MESWTKQEWVHHIEARLVHGPFVYRAFFPTKTHLLFACDVFRRKGHCVRVFFEVVEEGPPCTGVVISPDVRTTDITIRRDSVLEDVLACMSEYSSVRVRGCGTTLQMVSDVVHMAICNGWFVVDTQLGTLVKVVGGIKQRNTTLIVTVHKGSDLYVR